MKFWSNSRLTLQVAWKVLVAGAAVSAAVHGQQVKTSAASDWPMFDRDLGGTRYSPLSQIDVKNVSRLTLKWSLRLRDDLSDRPSEFTGMSLGYNDSSPIVIGGVMYVATGKRVVALATETGKEIWSYQTAPHGRPHGVAYWPGDRETAPRIFFAIDDELTALNASTGRIDPGFGVEGKLKTVVAISGVPTVYKDILLVGAAVWEQTVGPPGDTRAYHARTGKKLWDFHSVPQPGEFGHETWQGDGWKGRSGVNVWAHSMTVDEERGIVYMPLGGPAANFYGGDRPGNNLFGSSLVAVDAETGKLKWHFQTVHHDIWDTDQPAAPGLIDLTQNGKTVPALALIGKPSLMFILDRVTGKPVFGVEERPVPAGDVPGEWYSPTQPFPVKPPPLARDRFKPEDIVTADDTNAEHAAACKSLYDEAGGLYNKGPFTPFLLSEKDKPPKTGINFPGNIGGVNWGGAATDPKLGFVFAFTKDLGTMGWIEKDVKGAEGYDLPYYFKSVDGAGGGGSYRYFAVAMRDKDGRLIAEWPCQKPPWGQLVAVNANTGEIAWKTTLGVTDELPEAKRKTGRPGNAGPIVTAGGLVFIGATNDKRLRAFDSRTGKELWETKLIASAAALPITYQGKDGNQYVAIIAGQTLVVFGLR